MTGDTGYRLGVDLGTTWTAAVVDDGEATQPLPLGDQGPAIASVIARDGDTWVFGSAAERLMLVAPASGAREVKRRVGDAAPMLVAGTPYAAEALLGALLGHVIERATEVQGGPPDQVVLTHPAVWGEYKLDVLRAAAQAAGLDAVELLPEPTAAAIHYAILGKIAPGDTVAVYDFGGGTFDAAVLHHSDDGFEVLGTPQGIERLGGIDLDTAVLAHVDAALDGQLRELDRENAEVRQGLTKLRDECVRAKEALSADTETTIPVNLPGLQTSVRLTRAEMEAMVRPRLDDTLAALERAVASAGLTNDDLASVLLVGGTSRMPMVGEVVGASTGRPTTIDAHPKLVVAGGAAEAPRLAAALATDAAGTAADEVDEDDEGGATDATEAREERGTGATGGAVKAKAGAGAAAGGTPAPRRGARLGGAAGVAAAVGVVAGAAAAADAVFGSGKAGASTGHPGAPGHQAPGTAEALAHPGAHDAGATAHEQQLRQQLEARAAMAASAREHLVGGGSGHAGGGAARGGVAHQYAREGAPMAHAAAPAQHAPDQFEQYRDEMMERLASWPGPAGASPEQVAHLREELVGVIHRAEHIPGQSLENAQAELQDRLDDKLHIYEQDQKLDGLMQEEQREAQQHAEEINHEQHFGEFQKSIADSVQGWHPAWWGDGAPNDGAALASLKAEVNGLVVGMQYDANKPIEQQEAALRESVKGLMQTFQNEQYQQFGKDQNAAYDQRYNASFQMPGGMGVAERNMINTERQMLADAVAEKLQQSTLPDDTLPPVPADVTLAQQQALQESAARMAEQEGAHVAGSSNVDPSNFRTLGDAFETLYGDGHGDGAPADDPMDQSSSFASPVPTHETLVMEHGATAATADDDDFLGAGAATQHLTTIASIAMAGDVAHEVNGAPAEPGDAGAPDDPSTAAAGDDAYAMADAPAPDHAVDEPEQLDPMDDNAPADVAHHHGDGLQHEIGSGAVPGEHEVAGAVMTHDMNPFGHDEPIAPPPEHEMSFAPVHDEPPPVMTNPDDDLP